MLPLGRYRAFRLNAILMAPSTNLTILQPSDMFNVQPPLLHSVKLEKQDKLLNLSNDSSKSALPNVPPPIPTAYTPISDSKCSEHPKLVFTPIGSFGHSNLFQPPCHPNTCEYPSIMQYLRCLASFLGSRNKLASIDYDKIIYYKVQYLPPLYNGDVIFELPPSHVSASTSKNIWMVWIRSLMVTLGATPSPPIFTTAKALLLGSPCVLGSWFVTIRIVTSSLDPPSVMKLSGQAKSKPHSN